MLVLSGKKAAKLRLSNVHRITLQLAMAHRDADIDLVTLEQKDFNNWLDTVRGVEEEEQALAAQAAAENARLAAGNAQFAAEAHEEREAMIGFDD
jgi:hypothetical protein